MKIEAPNFDAINDAIDKWEDLKDKIGATDLFDALVTLPSGSFVFENKWEEGSDFLADYVWSFDAVYETSIEAKCRVKNNFPFFQRVGKRE